MEMTKQLMFEQFNKLETNSEKAEYLTKIKEEKQQVEIVNNRYVLAPVKQATLYDIFFTINPFFL